MNIDNNIHTLDIVQALKLNLKSKAPLVRIKHNGKIKCLTN